MRSTFEKIGLIGKATYSLDMRNTEFRGYLQSVVGNKKELKLFINPDFQYYGQVDLSSFEITENDTTFGNTSDAKLTGIVIELEDKIEIQIESLLLDAREYLFVIAGITMLILGLYKILTGDITNEDYSVALIGIFFLVFTYCYIRIDSRKAIKHFDSTIEKIIKLSK